MKLFLNKGKNPICTSLVTLLIFNLALASLGEASPETEVKIDPTPKIASVGETFEIDVYVSDVVKLGGFEFCLGYDTIILDCLDVAESSPFLESFGEIQILLLSIEDDYNATHGRVWVAISILGTPEGATGSGVLSTITFEATALGECVLDLHSITSVYPSPVEVYVPDEIILGDTVGLPIEHEVVDGYFTDIPRPWIYVDPSRIVPPPYLLPSENFTISLNIFNITNLHSSEFKLAYNATLLEALNVTEGDFLKNTGTTDFTPNINKTLGVVSVNVTLVDPIGASTTGNETLATVTFNVTSIGECELDLYDTKLTDPTATPIEHYTFDGYFSNKAVIHDIAVIEVTTTPTSMVYSGNNVTIKVRVRNNGTEPETLEVTAYYDNTAVKTQKITALPAGAFRTLTFEWDTTGVELGNYTIRAKAVLLEKTDDNLANNERTKDGEIEVLPIEEPSVFPTGIAVAVVLLIIAVIVGIIFYRRRKS